MGRRFAKLRPSVVAVTVLGSTLAIGSIAPVSAFATPSCGALCFVDASTGNDGNAGTFAAPLKTIQAGIDAVDPGGTVKVRPGSYNETAANVSPVSVAGTYTFGLYLGKTGVTVEGVHADDSVITSRSDPAIPTVTTNSTANFGPDGVFVEGDNDTISGLSIGANAGGCNKTIEVVGDAFTFQNGVVNDPCRGDIYIDDFRYNTGSGTPHVNSYTITGSEFGPGNTIDIGSGPGHGTAASNRLITNNVFDGGGGFGGLNGGGYWPAISFNGAGSGVAWFLYPVGGATITGNTFAARDQYIRARGTYDTATFDWNSYFAGNTFPGAAMTTTPTSDVETYAYSYTLPGYGCPANFCSWNNIRRINGTLQTAHGSGCLGADCKGDVDNALPGDTVKIQGTMNESVNLTKAVSLLGFGTTATLNGAGTGVPVNAPGPLSISFLHFTGFDPSVDVASTSVAPTVIRNALVKLVNGSASTVNATCNWWGQNTGPLGGQTVGPALTNPWLNTSTLSGPCTGPTVPDAPTIGTASATGGVGTVTVSFTPNGDGGSPITGFTTTCVSLAGQPTVVATGTTSPITVPFLQGGTPYQCSVTATNLVGTGPPSGLTNVVWPAQGAPSNCDGTMSATDPLTTAPGNGYAVVSWAPSHPTPGCVAGYVVTPYLGSVAQLATLIPGHGTTTVIKGLMNGQSYRFTVAPEDGHVQGPASAMSGSITVGAPSAAVVTRVIRVAKGALRVAFNTPNNNGAPITGYTVSCTSTNGGTTKSKTGKAGPLTVTGLTARRTYTCTVKATNKRGTGPPSRASQPVKA